MKKTLKILLEILKRLIDVLKNIYQSCYNPFTNECDIRYQSCSDCPICMNFHGQWKKSNISHLDMLKWWFKSYFYMAFFESFYIPIKFRNINDDIEKWLKELEKEYGK